MRKAATPWTSTVVTVLLWLIILGVVYAAWSWFGPR